MIFNMKNAAKEAREEADFRPLTGIMIFNLAHVNEIVRTMEK